MKVLIFDTAEAAAQRCAAHLLDRVRENPCAVLGLATGGTMLPVYDRVATTYLAERVSFSQVTTFNLDEYVGLASKHVCSYHYYMRVALFDRIDIDLGKTHIPKGDAVDLAAEARAYEQQITASGGIDLQLLGIGQNGHIGFNEPTSSLASRTRVIVLTEETRHANRIYFTKHADTPRCAITMGIGTILAAKACLVLATGEGKSDAIAAMIEGPLSARCPASALQMHPAVTVILDRAAAAGLKLGDDYQRVHRDVT